MRSEAIMKSLSKTISDTIYYITLTVAGIFATWSIGSFFYGPTIYYRKIFIYLSYFTAFTILANCILIKEIIHDKPFSRISKIICTIFLILVILSYNYNALSFTNYSEFASTINASIIYSYDDTDWMGDGDMYAILETTQENIKKYQPTLRPFDKDKDWHFLGNHLKLEPSQFSNCMVSEKLGPYYYFEINGNEKVTVHIVHLW
jgi:hypothetical protein